MAADARHLGPLDYSRTQQLEDIEKALDDPDAFRGMEPQLVTEALVAAKLSRNLELPRVETEGRFARAIRLAETHGTNRQKAETRYEALWTTYWWFDDVALLSASYDGFEARVLVSDQAKTLEFFCNLLQLLFNSVIHGHLSAEDAKLTARIKTLTQRLEQMALDQDQPNNALEAKTSLLIIQLNEAFLTNDHERISRLWPEFSHTLVQAKGLGEFAPERLVKMIEIFGNVAGKDPAYDQLVEEVAAFVAERTSEGEGGLVLLKRAQQLDFDDHFNMIRLLGRAARQLTKKEYAEKLIEAMQRLALAYRSAGLLWAARASCIFAAGSIIIESKEESEMRLEIIPTIDVLAWLSLELRHLPDYLEAMRLLNGFARGLPLDERSRARLSENIQELDMAQASRIVNFSPSELEDVDSLPDILEALGLFYSRAALLYVLGYESVLRDDGSVPEGHSPEEVAELFSMLASQPISERVRGPLILNGDSEQTLTSTIMGVEIEVRVNGSTTSLLLAEALVGSLEAQLATALELEVHPHTERFSINILERAQETRPEFRIDSETMCATLIWPKDQSPAAYDFQVKTGKTLMEIAGTVLASICVVKNLESTLTTLYQDELVMDRVSMILATGNSYHRIFGQAVSRLSNWSKLVRSTFPLRAERPTVSRHRLEISAESQSDRCTADREKEPGFVSDHRDISVRSVIDVHLWDRAGWKGVAFASFEPGVPPAIGLLFDSEDAARRIFDRWRLRFGTLDHNDEIYIAIIRSISEANPFHYRLMITSRDADKDLKAGQRIMVAARMQTMEPDSDRNLNRFLSEYDRTRSYLLVPAIWRADRAPNFLNDLAIVKRQLTVKSAKEITTNDMEIIALRDGSALGNSDK